MPHEKLQSGKLIEKKNRRKLSKLEMEAKGTYIQYLMNLGLGPEQLKDKKILDIGGGQGPFGYYLRKAELSKKVANLDFQKFVEDINTQRVVGFGEQAPFKDDSFDMVISHAAVPQVYSLKYYENRERKAVIQLIEESFRILKMGGEIRFSFVTSNERPWFDKVFKIIREELVYFKARHPNSNVSLRFLYENTEPKFDKNLKNIGELKNQHYVLIIKK